MRRSVLLMLLMTAVMLGGCASRYSGTPVMDRELAEQRERGWDALLAEDDALRDIAASRIRFAYIGGIALYPPGIPSYKSAMELVEQYKYFVVGEAGCIKTRPVEGQYEYATLYNQTMWRHITKPVLVKERADLFGNSDQQEEWTSYWRREHWLVADAVADAQRDIEVSNIQFACIYYFFPSYPGLPEAVVEAVDNGKYESFPIGESGCVRTDTSKDENDELYARLYNQHMWQHVSSMKAKPEITPE